MSLLDSYDENKESLITKLTYLPNTTYVSCIWIFIDIFINIPSVWCSVLSPSDYPERLKREALFVCMYKPE